MTTTAPPRGRSIRALVYAFRRGLEGMLQTPLIQVLGIITSAVCMVLLATLALVWLNAQDLAHAWGRDVPIVAYLDDEMTTIEATQLRDRIEGLSPVTHVDLIDPQMAASRLVEGLGDPTLMDGIDASVLPYSLEIHLSLATPRALETALADKIGHLRQIEDVSVASEWAVHLDQLLETWRILAVTGTLIASIACLAIGWCMSRLAIYARRSEIQILELIGGTPRFVRGPFVVEGAIQGALSSGLAIVVLSTCFDAISPYVEGGLSLVFAAHTPRFFSGFEIAIAIATGTALGWLGARVATGRSLSS